VADLTECIRLSPKDDGAYLKRAELYVSLNQTALALADYTDIVSKNAWDEQAFAGKAECEFALKQYGNALHNASKAIELDSANGRAYFVRSLIYTARGQKDLAAADLKKAAEFGYDLKKKHCSF